MSGSSDCESQDRPRADRRIQTRIGKTRVAGILTVSGIERTYRVSDLTPEGVKLEGHDLPLPGQRVSFGLEDMAPASAVIVWRDATQCGLRFEADQSAQPIFANDA